MKLFLTIVLFLVLTACASSKSKHCDAYGSTESIENIDMCSK
jgi:hypothetical protein